MTLADRIAIMKDGLIQQLDTPHGIYDKPVNKYVADFIGSPAMNFFEGNVDSGLFTAGDLKIDLKGYEFTPAAKPVVRRGSAFVPSTSTSTKSCP